MKISECPLCGSDLVAEEERTEYITFRECEFDLSDDLKYGDYYDCNYEDSDYGDGQGKTLRCESGHDIDDMLEHLKEKRDEEEEDEEEEEEEQEVVKAHPLGGCSCEYCVQARADDDEVEIVYQ